MRIALATCAALPDGWHDDRLLARELEVAGAAVEFVAWDEAQIDWDRFDRVVVRSTWDYTRRREEFLAWAERIGEDRLRNRPQLIRWNSDKVYLADLQREGLPVIDTTLVRPDDPLPTLEGEVVVKPTISAGARDTGRFSPRAHREAITLLNRLRAEGRTAMVQPYASGIDAAGETAIVFLAGRESHVLRKRPVLRPDEIAPIREDELGAAEAMFSDDLVTAATATEQQRSVATAVVAYLERRFGACPLYVRVDLAPGADGDVTIMELEAVEPSLYMQTAPASARRFAETILAEA